VNFAQMSAVTVALYLRTFPADNTIFVSWVQNAQNICRLCASIRKNLLKEGPIYLTGENFPSYLETRWDFESGDMCTASWSAPFAVFVTVLTEGRYWPRRSMRNSGAMMCICSC